MRRLRHHFRVILLCLVCVGANAAFESKSYAQPEGCEAVHGSSNWFKGVCRDIGRGLDDVWFWFTDLFDKPRKKDRENEAAEEVHPQEFFVRWLDDVDIHDGNPWVDDSDWESMVESAIADAEDEARYLAEVEMLDLVHSLIGDFEAAREEHLDIAQEVYDSLAPGSSELEDLIAHPAILDTLETIRLSAPSEHPVLATVATAHQRHSEAQTWFDRSDSLLDALLGKVSDLEAVETYRDDAWFEFPTGLPLAVQEISGRIQELTSILEDYFEEIDDAPFDEDSDYRAWLCDLEWWMVESIVQHEIRSGIDLEWENLPIFGGCGEGEPHAAGISVAGSRSPSPEEIIRVIQLGDSYSAGLGTLDDRVPAPPSGQGHCNDPEYSNIQVTPGFRLAEHIEQTTGRQVRYVFAACAGAEVYRSNPDLQDQWHRIMAEELDLGTGENTIIVFTFGGNDLRTWRDLSWPELMQDCFWYDCAHPLVIRGNQIENIAELYSEYVHYLREIARDVPDATIRVLGYPTPFQPVFRDTFGPGNNSDGPSDRRHCRGMLSISVTEADFLDGQSNLAIDALQAAVADAASYSWIDLWFQDVRPLFRGHGLCDARNSFLNNIGVNIWQLEAQANSLHPRIEGYDAYFHALLDSLGW
ncbi:MAG: hypothetical protein AAF604_14860 [Acidobacteriota bacterium]